MMVPQVVRLIRTKKAGDLSLGTAALYVANCVLWFTYGHLTKTPPVMLANAVGFVIGMLQLILIIKIRYITVLDPTADDLGRK
jgi:MtN3 and saliva related transmembrane protein